MLFNELPIIFPWYRDIRLQNRFNENSQGQEVFKLISPKNALLPFQFRRVNGLSGNPVSWYIMCENGGVLVNLSGNLGLITKHIKDGNAYYLYHGNPLTEPGPVPLSIPEGFYYSVINFDSESFYSELFYIPNDSFTEPVPDFAPPGYLCFTWWNNSDLRPIFYPFLWVQRLYIDTFITSSEPEIMKTGEEDGNGEMVATFQKVVINHRINLYVPDFVKRALFVMCIHDSVAITTKGGFRTGIVLNPTLASTTDVPGVYSAIDLTFQSEIAVTKAGCSDNMVTT